MLLVKDTLVGTSSGFARLLQLGNLGSLFSDLTSLGEGSVLLAH
jgi:hypothetical protein